MEADTPTRFELITESRRECERMSRVISAQIQKYTSSAYGGGPMVADDPENYAYAYIANAAARNLIADPRAHLAWGQDEVSEQVMDLERGINAWFVDTNYRSLRERLLIDMTLGYCVAAVSQEPRAGFEEYDDEALQTPKLRRIPPSMFGWDVAANSFEECQFLFHTIVRKKARMVKECREEDGWNMEAVNMMAEDFGVAETRPNKEVLRRGEVAYFELWDAEYELEETDAFWQQVPPDKRNLFHGTIFTIGWGGGPSDGLGKALDLRRPRPYFGPRGGPYTLGGFLSVPNKVPPLSALVANKAQIDSLNRQARANDKSAESFATNTIVDAPTADGRAAVIGSNSGDLLAIPGLTKDRVFDVTRGGVQPEAASREEFLRQRADRNVGTSDELRGQANPQTNATNAVIAANAAGGVNNLFDAKFADFEARSCMGVLFFMVNDDRTVVRGGGQSIVTATDEAGLARTVDQGFLSEDQAASILQPPEAQEEPFAFDDLAVRIESMRLDGTEERRFVEINNLLLAWAPALPMVAQYADLTPLWQRAADVYRFPELRRIFNQDAAAELGVAQMEAEQESAAGGEQRTIPATPTGGAKVSVGAGGKPSVKPGKTDQSKGPNYVMGGGKKK